MDEMNSNRIKMLRIQYDRAVKETAKCEKDLDDARYWVEFTKSEIQECRELADEKFEEMRECRSCGDWAYADILREEGEILNNETDDKRMELEECYERLNEAKKIYRQASRREREIKKELDIELGQGNWRRKACKGCGNAITYRIDWEHIPNYCGACKEKFNRERRR